MVSNLEKITQFYLGPQKIHRSIWDPKKYTGLFGTLTGTTTPGQSGPRSNGNKEVLNIFQISRTLASPSDAS